MRAPAAMMRKRSLMLVIIVFVNIVVSATTIVSTASYEAAAAVERDHQKAAKTRSDRFPSIEQRVRLYMSNWYHPPCSNYTEGLIRYSYHHGGEDRQQVLLHLESSYRPPNISNCSTAHNHRKLKKQADLSRLNYYLIESAIQPDQVFYVDRKALIRCGEQAQLNKTASTRALTSSSSSTTTSTEHKDHSNNNKMEIMNNMRMYCQDTIRSLQEAWDHVIMTTTDEDGIPAGSSLTDDDIPLLLQYGDMKTSHGYGMLELPHIKKFRSAVVSPGAAIITDSSSTANSSFCLQQPPTPLFTVHGSRILQPIIWKLATHRHYRQLPQVYRHDTPWPLKRNQAIFRGQLTGALEFYNKSVSDLDNCMKSRRCRLVYQHAHSPWIDAKLTSTRQRLPTILNHVNMTSPSVTIRHLLQYKAIIMLEGNDVASGLKWALLSQSVVLMPPPHHTSWAMEELLQPWVHYIPLLPDACDVEDKMKWIVQHDAEARWIAEQGTLWMEDLVFHPDAKQDDRLIEEEILRRYRTHFRHAPINVMVA